jgi:hypothetical protein
MMLGSYTLNTQVPMITFENQGIRKMRYLSINPAPLLLVEGLDFIKIGNVFNVHQRDNVLNFLFKVAGS